jgi:Skp family chaperone for outer membrane proteins
MTDNTETTPDRLSHEYPHERKHIRWDPTINTGHILSAGTSIIAALVFTMASWSTMDKRLVVLEEARLSQNQVTRDRADQVNEKFKDVKESLTDIKTSVENLRRELQEKRK